MKNSHLYSVLALLIVLSIAGTSGCSAVVAPGTALVVPAVSSASSNAATVSSAVTQPAVTGNPDLVITRIWLC